MTVPEKYYQLPDGNIRMSTRPQAEIEQIYPDWLYLPEGFPPDPDPAPTKADVNAERDRRNVENFSFEGNVFQADPVSRGRIAEARISALAAKLAGAQAGDLRWHGLPVDFVWITADNQHVPMDADTVIRFGNAIVAREGVLVLAGDAIKRIDPIPQDFKEPTYWETA